MLGSCGISPCGMSACGLLEMVGAGAAGVGVGVGVAAGVVNKSGSWFSYGDERIGQGRENAKQFLRDHSAISYDIEDKIRAAHGLDFNRPDAGDEDDILEG